jgi:hypothetical protein
LKSYKNESSDQIEKDLSRSFPGHPFFESPQGRRSLQNVLTAFSWLNPAIGYTQSMNFWVGLMLIFIPEEVRSKTTTTTKKKKTIQLTRYYALLSPNRNASGCSPPS